MTASDHQTESETVERDRERDDADAVGATEERSEPRLDGDSDTGACETRLVGEHRVRGVAVDPDTLCAHYDTERDVVAIAFACCGEFYPCHACHETCADHDATQWPQSRFGEHAVLCGACATPLTIDAYLSSGDACPSCEHAFNPGCAAHADRYFDV